MFARDLEALSTMLLATLHLLTGSDAASHAAAPWRASGLGGSRQVGESVLDVSTCRQLLAQTAEAISLLPPPQPSALLPDSLLSIMLQLGHCLQRGGRSLLRPHAPPRTLPSPAPSHPRHPPRCHAPSPLHIRHWSLLASLSRTKPSSRPPPHLLPRPPPYPYGAILLSSQFLLPPLPKAHITFSVHQPASTPPSCSTPSTLPSPYPPSPHSPSPPSAAGPDNETLLASLVQPLVPRLCVGLTAGAGAVSCPAEAAVREARVHRSANLHICLLGCAAVARGPLELSVGMAAEGYLVGLLQPGR